VTSGHAWPRYTICPLRAQIIVEADARSPYNYRPKPCNAISRVCPCRYRDLVANVPYKTSKFQRLSAIVTVPTAWRYSYRAHTLKSSDFIPRHPYRETYKGLRPPVWLRSKGGVVVRISNGNIVGKESILPIEISKVGHRQMSCRTLV
jgi:hypothetical protein